MEEKVKLNDTVKIHFTGQLSDQTVFATSDGYEPIEIVAGGTDVFEKVSQAIIGMKVGEKKEIHLEAAEAYGEFIDDLVVQVPLEQLPGDIEVGAVLTNPSNEEETWTVDKVENTTATLNGNHPLAGQEVFFSIEIVAIEQKAAVTKLVFALLLEKAFEINFGLVVNML